MFFDVLKLKRILLQPQQMSDLIQIELREKDIDLKKLITEMERKTDGMKNNFLE